MKDEKSDEYRLLKAFLLLKCMEWRDAKFNKSYITKKDNAIRFHFTTTNGLALMKVDLEGIVMGKITRGEHDLGVWDHKKKVELIERALPKTLLTAKYRKSKGKSGLWAIQKLRRQSNGGWRGLGGVCGGC